MEKFANNFLTIVIARVAMMITPVLLMIIWNTMNARIEALELTSARNMVILQDHESRLVNGRAARMEFQATAAEQIKDTNASLRALSDQMVMVNGNLIRLQTVLENRLPSITK
jgi:hypothetical protein